MLISTNKNLKNEELKSFLPVTMAADIKSVLPFADSAEAEYISPLIGSDLYRHLCSFYSNPEKAESWIGDNKAKWLELLTNVQRSVINLAYWLGYDLLSIEIDSTGFHRQETTEKKSVYHYQENSLKNGFLHRGFNGLDQVLAYLDSNILIFPDFKTSASYSFRKASLIPDTATFNAIYFIDSSRLIFLRLQRYIDQVEDFTISAVLGSALYAKVKAEIVKDSPAAEVTALLPYLRKPLCHLAIAKALGELGVNITDRAIFMQTLAATAGNTIERKPVSEPILMQLIKTAQETGDLYLLKLKSFLAADPTKYPEYSGQVGSIYNRDNTDKKTFWTK